MYIQIANRLKRTNQAEDILGGGGMSRQKVSNSMLNMASSALHLKSLNARLFTLEDILQLHFWIKHFTDLGLC